MDHFYQEIQGWFDFNNLYSFIVEQSTGPAVFVEVGAWKGKSVAYLGVEIKNSNKDIVLYAVDTFVGSNEPAYQQDASVIKNILFEEFCNNIKPLSDIVFPIRKSSIEASMDFEDRSVDFVFIDAGHGYEDAYADICSWLPKVKSGGWIAGHDYGSSQGVRAAVTKLLPDAMPIPPNSWMMQVR